MISREESLLSFIIILTALTSFILPAVLFYVLAFTILSSMGIKLYIELKKNSYSHYLFSFIFGGLIMAASWPIKNEEFSRCLFFIGFFWLIRGTLIILNIVRNKKKESGLHELQLKEGSKKEEVDYQRFIEVLVNRMDKQVEYIASSLGDIQSKLTVLEMNNSSEFEQELKAKLSNDVIADIKTFIHTQGNSINKKEIENAIEKKFEILNKNIEDYKNSTQVETKKYSKNVEEAVEILLKTYNNLENSLEDKQNYQLAQMEELYGLFKKEKINFGEINNAIAKYVQECTGFSKDSIDSLATAVSQEMLSDYSLHHITYGGLTSHYTGIFEQEMRIIISLNKRSPKAENLMWNQICAYLRNNEISILTDYIPDFYRYMVELQTIRNKAAHGETVSREEFEKVKQLAMEKRAFYYMSQAKLKLMA